MSCLLIFTTKEIEDVIAKAARPWVQGEERNGSGATHAQPIFDEIDRTVCQRDPCWPWLSRTKRTARSRTSGENLFVVLLMMLHPTQELEPPANPARVWMPPVWQA